MSKGPLVDAIEAVEKAIKAWSAAHPAIDDAETDALIAALQDYKKATAAVIAAIPRS